MLPANIYVVAALDSTHINFITCLQHSIKKYNKLMLSFIYSIPTIGDKHCDPMEQSIYDSDHHMGMSL